MSPTPPDPSPPARPEDEADTEHGMSTEELGRRFPVYFKPAPPDATDVAPAPEAGREPMTAEEFDKKVFGYHGEPCDRYKFAEAYAESRLSAVVEALREWEPYIEFYAEREMNSPSNNQEAVIEVRDLLRRFRAILRDFPQESKP